ncbi:Phosphatidate cytidylyltransferase 4, chloroplastic [Dionaea muscipula]
MALQVGIDRSGVNPLTVTALCPCSKVHALSKSGGTILGLGSQSTKVKFRLVVHGGSHGVLRVPKVSPMYCRLFMAVAKAESDFVGEGVGEEEVGQSYDLSKRDNLHTGNEHKASQLKKRVLSGLGIGIAVGSVVLAGGWVFTIAVAAAAYVGAREYFELVRSRGIASGMTPPPRYVSRVCSIISALMPILTLYCGHAEVSVAFAAFVVAITLLLQRGNPRFAQLSSSMFGLFYCGYLPCFWVKLRCNFAAPALNTEISGVWPVVLGGQTHWTVGLVATFFTISSIIAADTFAFLGGKAFGRTPLINISPKKTWEGALIGLVGCIAASTILSKILSWPKSLPRTIAFGFLIFFGSLFGDLTESMIKRDAGVKDSGTLIPGHGGLLDRADSYMFTGALAYSFVKIFLPLFGV